MAKGAPKTTQSGPRVRADNDIYTVMVAIAVTCVVGTFAFAIYRCSELLGKPFPGF